MAPGSRNLKQPAKIRKKNKTIVHETPVSVFLTLVSPRCPRRGLIVALAHVVPDALSPMHLEVLLAHSRNFENVADGVPGSLHSPGISGFVCRPVVHHCDITGLNIETIIIYTQNCYMFTMMYLHATSQFDLFERMN